MDVDESDNSSSVFIKVDVGHDFDYEEESPEPMEIRQKNKVQEVKDEIFDESSSSDSIDDYHFQNNVQCPECFEEFEDESCLKSHIVLCPGSNSTNNSDCGGTSTSSSQINKRQDIPSMTFHDAIKNQLRQKVLDRMVKKETSVNKGEEGDKESTNEGTLDTLTCKNATPFIINSKSEKPRDDCPTTTSKESKRAVQMKKLRLPSSTRPVKFWTSGFPYRIQALLLAKKSLTDLTSSSSSSTTTTTINTDTPNTGTFKGIINSNSTTAIDSPVNVLKNRKPKRLPKIFKCQVEGCDRRFSKLQAMYGHSAMHKRTDYPKNKVVVRDSTTCQVPSCKMTGIEDMEFHMRSHMRIKTGSYICPICDMNKEDMDKLADHMMNSHGVTMPAIYRCLKCDQIFNTPGMRGIHMRKTHQAL